MLTNQVGCYEGTLRKKVRLKLKEEVERWIDERILIPWTGKAEGVLPLMAVVQPTKNKVRLVLDFRELNKYMACHTKDEIDICEEVMREWRRMERSTKIVDLKLVYLQIEVDKKLWQYQLVKYKGRVYCLTRLGFRLNSAPKIMTAVLKNVLAKDKAVKRATCSFINDILVDETEVTAERVREHVNTYRLTAKPTALEDGMALSLKLQRNKEGKLVFRRGSKIPEVQGSLTKQELFSVCRKLVGHCPIVRWLRVACSFIKRQTNGGRWKDGINHEVLWIIQEVFMEVKKVDPVKGEWHLRRSKEGVIWCDASSLALEAILEIGGAMAEYAAWLRKKNDNAHINVAELDATIKGINLALKWGRQAVEIRTDSATVASWIKSEVSGDRRTKTKGAAEMLIKHQLGTFGDLIREFGLKIIVTLVQSQKNKADMLTRVKRAWLQEKKDRALLCCVGEDLKDLHNMHHFGRERTLYLVRKVNPNITMEAIQEVVKQCKECQSTDPVPTRHEKGELHVT